MESVKILNEYLANCLTRITINEDDFEKKLRERKEVEAEEKKRFEMFRMEKSKFHQASRNEKEEKDN